MKRLGPFAFGIGICLLSSCQPVHVETHGESGLHPLSRTFIVGEDTWVEIKINSSGEESVVSFDKGIPDSFLHVTEYSYDVLKWRIKVGKHGALDTPKLVATLAYKQSTKRIEIRLSTQASNSLAETIKVLVQIIH